MLPRRHNPVPQNKKRVAKKRPRPAVIRLPPRIQTRTVRQATAVPVVAVQAAAAVRHLRRTQIKI